MRLFPCVTNAGSLTIGKGSSVDGVGILMIQNEYIMVAAAGWDGKFAGLIRIGLVELLFGEKSSTNLMGAIVKSR